MARGRILMVMRLLVDRHGGAERVFCDLANLLAEAGHEVAAVHYDAKTGALPARLSRHVERINLRGRSRHAPWYLALDAAAAGYPALGALAPAEWLARNLHFVRRLHALMRERRPDLVISFLPPANTPALLAGRLAGVRVMPTNHNVPEEDYRSTARWSQNPLDRRLRLWSLRTAERIHVLFPSFAAWFPAELQDRIVAIPNGVSPEIWAAEPAAARRPEIVAVGRLAEVKNHRTLVDAWAMIAPRHPGWSVKIVGTGPEEAALRTRIDERGVAASCRLVGRVDDVARVYLEAEILAHPARFEGFGLVVAEAIACGAPAVAFGDCAGVNELVKDGVNGLLVERSGGAAALAAGLERLIVDEPLRAALRARGRESMRPYRPEAFRAGWLRVVDELVAPRQ